MYVCIYVVYVYARMDTAIIQLDTVTVTDSGMQQQDDTVDLLLLSCG